VAAGRLIQFAGIVTKLTLTHDATDAPRTAAFASGQLEPDGLGGGLMAMLSELKTALETGTPPRPR
jgi:hypothetical protein